MQSFIRRISIGSSLVVALSGLALPAQAADPLSGTWELNVAKSTFSPGPPQKSQTRTYEATATGMKFTAKGVEADGKDSLVEFTASYDGKDNPITGSPDADTISVKRIDDYTADSTQKKAGKVVLTNHRVISKDGKSMTLTTKGTNAKGQAVHNVLVFDKK